MGVCHSGEVRAHVSPKSCGKSKLSSRSFYLRGHKQYKMSVICKTCKQVRFTEEEIKLLSDTSSTNPRYLQNNVAFTGIMIYPETCKNCSKNKKNGINIEWTCQNTFHNVKNSPKLASPRASKPFNIDFSKISTSYVESIASPTVITITPRVKKLKKY